VPYGKNNEGNKTSSDNYRGIVLSPVLSKLLEMIRILNNAAVKRELLDTIKARKLAYYGHTMSKQGSCQEKEIMQGTMPGVHAVEEDHTRPEWTTSIRGQNSPWKSQSE